MSSDERRQASQAALDNCASFVLRRANRIVGQYFDEALQPTGLKSTQLTLLMVIDTHPDDPMHVIAQSAGLSPSTLSRNLQPLLKMGLIEVRGSNRSGKYAKLTRKGVRLLEKSFPLWDAVQERFAGVYGDPAWVRLRKALQKATEAIEELERQES